MGFLNSPVNTLHRFSKSEKPPKSPKKKSTKHALAPISGESVNGRIEALKAHADQPTPATISPMRYGMLSPPFVPGGEGPSSQTSRPAVPSHGDRKKSLIGKMDKDTATSEQALLEEHERRKQAEREAQREAQTARQEELERMEEGEADGGNGGEAEVESPEERRGETVVERREDRHEARWNEDGPGHIGTGRADAWSAVLNRTTEQPESDDPAHHRGDQPPAQGPGSSPSEQLSRAVEQLHVGEMERVVVGDPSGVVDQLDGDQQQGFMEDVAVVPSQDIPCRVSTRMRCDHPDDSDNGSSSDDSSSDNGDPRDAGDGDGDGGEGRRGMEDDDEHRQSEGDNKEPFPPQPAHGDGSGDNPPGDPVVSPQSPVTNAPGPPPDDPVLVPQPPVVNAPGPTPDDPTLIPQPPVVNVPVPNVLMRYVDFYRHTLAVDDPGLPNNVSHDDSVPGEGPVNAMHVTHGAVVDSVQDPLYTSNSILDAIHAEFGTVHDGIRTLAAALDGLIEEARRAEVARREEVARKHLRDFERRLSIEDAAPGGDISAVERAAINSITTMRNSALRSLEAARVAANRQTEGTAKRVGRDAVDIMRQNAENIATAAISRVEDARGDVVAAVQQAGEHAVRALHEAVAEFRQELAGTQPDGEADTDGSQRLQCRKRSYPFEYEPDGDARMAICPMKKRHVGEGLNFARYNLIAKHRAHQRLVAASPSYCTGAEEHFGNVLDIFLIEGVCHKGAAEWAEESYEDQEKRRQQILAEQKKSASRHVKWLESYLQRQKKLIPELLNCSVEAPFSDTNVQDLLKGIEDEIVSVKKEKRKLKRFLRANDRKKWKTSIARREVETALQGPTSGSEV
ncbi:Hypothetical protein YALI2_C00203g [Yarrowia lipolytica]|nr:Hypothetical protein YALI2_C00203g [Yarrowia lipolytica]